MSEGTPTREDFNSMDTAVTGNGIATGDERTQMTKKSNNEKKK